MKTLILHGALGAASQMRKIHEKIPDAEVLNFPGHGGRANSGSFSIALFAQDVLKYMEEKSLDKVNILGYSMGGYVGLYLCRHYPEKVNKLMTIATKLDWNPEGAAREVKMLNPEVIEQKIPAFAVQLEERFTPLNWKEQVRMTAAMMLEMGDAPPLQENDFTEIHHPVLMAVGDRDKMVTTEETLKVYRLLPQAQCWVMPGTDHPVEKMDVPLLTDGYNRWVNS